eukprot:PhM_4_TR8820/c0_g1_i1/m.43723
MAAVEQANILGSVLTFEGPLAVHVTARKVPFITGAVVPNIHAVAMLFAALKLTGVGAVLVATNAAAVLLPVAEFTFVRPIPPHHLAVAGSVVIDKVANVLFPVNPHVAPFAVLFPVAIFSVVERPIGVEVLAVAVLATVLKVAFVARAVGPAIDALAVHRTFKKVTFVGTTVRPCVRPAAVLLTVGVHARVHTAVDPQISAVAVHETVLEMADVRRSVRTLQRPLAVHGAVLEFTFVRVAVPAQSAAAVATAVFKVAVVHRTLRRIQRRHPLHATGRTAGVQVRHCAVCESIAIVIIVTVRHHQIGRSVQRIHGTDVLHLLLFHHFGVGRGGVCLPTLVICGLFPHAHPGALKAPHAKTRDHVEQNTVRRAPRCDLRAALWACRHFCNTFRAENMSAR